MYEEDDEPDRWRGLQLDTGFVLYNFLSQEQIASSVRSANLQLGMVSYNMMPDDRMCFEMCNYRRGDVWEELVILRKCV